MEIELDHSGLWGNLSEEMKNLFPDSTFTFERIMEGIRGEDFNGIIDLFLSLLGENLSSEWTSAKSLISAIMVVVFLSSFITVLRSSFGNKQIAEIAYYSNYLVMVLILMGLVEEIIEITGNALIKMEEFMRIFFPTYFMIMAASHGIKTSLIYYQLSGLLIYFIEVILIQVIIPVLSIYMFIVFMNGIWEENRLNFLIHFIKKSVVLSFKLMMGIISGLGVIRSLIVPVAERIKGEGIYQMVEAVPGIGEITRGAMKMWMGSILLVKNGVGVAGCVILLGVTFLPILKIAFMAVSLKGATAVLSISGDKKIISCMNHVGNGISLCLKTTVYGVLFFLILIAITCYSTGGGI